MPAWPEAQCREKNGKINSRRRCKVAPAFSGLWFGKKTAIAFYAFAEKACEASQTVAFRFILSFSLHWAKGLWYGLQMRVMFWEICIFRLNPLLSRFKMKLAL